MKLTINTDDNSIMYSIVNCTNKYIEDYINTGDIRLTHRNCVFYALEYEDGRYTTHDIHVWGDEKHIRAYVYSKPDGSTQVTDTVE